MMLWCEEEREITWKQLHRESSQWNCYRSLLIRTYMTLLWWQKGKSDCLDIY